MEQKGIKIILLGEAGVGKTNLIMVYFGSSFQGNSLSTMSCSSFDGNIKYKKKVYNYSLWDTAGQERYRSLNKMFVRDAHIILLVYSIIDRNSFSQLNFWLNYLKENKSDDNYILGLVANKNDLFEIETVTEEEGEQFASDNNIEFVSTSAFSDSKSFKTFVNKLIIEYIENFVENANNQNTNNKNIKINNKNKNDNTKKGCC